MLLLTCPTTNLAALPVASLPPKNSDQVLERADTRQWLYHARYFFHRRSQGSLGAVRYRDWLPRLSPAAWLRPRSRRRPCPLWPDAPNSGFLPAPPAGLLL